MAGIKVVPIDSSSGSAQTARQRQTFTNPPLPAGTKRAAGGGRVSGVRERKKVLMRQRIVDTSIRLFRKQGYENTRVEDIVQILGISQPTFFRYFPSKDAVLREVGKRGYVCMREHLEAELAKSTSTIERLRRMYQEMAQEIESDQPLWRAIVLSGAMDPVRSPEVRRPDEMSAGLLRAVLMEGQKRGEITPDIPVAHLTEFMRGLYITIVRRWAVDLPGPHSLSERVLSAVDFFLRGVQV